jgi:hypothetical protein
MDNARSETSRTYKKKTLRYFFFVTTWGWLSLPNLQAGGPSLVGSPWVLIQYISIQPSYLKVLDTKDPLIVPLLLHIRSCIIWGMDKGTVSDPVPQRHSLTPPQQ